MEEKNKCCVYTFGQCMRSCTTKPVLSVKLSSWQYILLIENEVLIFTVRNWQYLHGTWSSLNILFWHRRKMYNFNPCNVFLAIAKNTPLQLKTGFVVQGHIFNLVKIQHIPACLCKHDWKYQITDIIQSLSRLQSCNTDKCTLKKCWWKRLRWEGRERAEEGW